MSMHQESAGSRRRPGPIAPVQAPITPPLLAERLRRPLYTPRCAGGTIGGLVRQLWRVQWSESADCASARGDAPRLPTAQPPRAP